MVYETGMRLQTTDNQLRKAEEGKRMVCKEARRDSADVASLSRASREGFVGSIPVVEGEGSLRTQYRALCDRTTSRRQTRCRRISRVSRMCRRS